MGCEFCEKDLRNECVCLWEIEDPRWAGSESTPLGLRDDLDSPRLREEGD